MRVFRETLTTYTLSVRHLALVLSGAAMLLAGCDLLDSPDDVEPPPPQYDDALVGEWRSENLPRWRWIIAEGGDMVAGAPGDYIPGRWETKPPAGTETAHGRGILEVTDISCYHLNLGETEYWLGSYWYSRTGDSLELALLEDQCAARRESVPRIWELVGTSGNRAENYMETKRIAVLK